MSNLASLASIATYHKDAEDSLREFYSPAYAKYQTRFFGYFPSEVASELVARVEETEMRSVLVILARIEAAFRRDYIFRATGKSADLISIEFRKLYRAKGKRVRLEEEILEVWRNQLEPEDRKNISALRGMLKYRHWLAHGRYWNQGSVYRYQDVYLLADVVLSSLPLHP